MNTIRNKLYCLEKFLRKESFQEETFGLMKLSGMLQAPPIMVREITEWAKSNIINFIACNYPLNNSNKNILKNISILSDCDSKNVLSKSFKVNLTNWKYISDEFMEENNEKIKLMSISTIEDLLRKSESSLSGYDIRSKIPPLGITVPNFIVEYYGAKKTISYNDAKKLLKKIKNTKFVFKNVMPENIMVNLSFDIYNKNVAEYHPSEIFGGTSSIYIYPASISEQTFWMIDRKPIEIKQEIDEIFFIMSNAIKHELIHFSQDLLSIIINSNKAGLPSKYLSVEKNEPDILYDISDYDSEDYLHKHDSSKIEFYPILEDEIEQFYRDNPINNFIVKGFSYDQFTLVQKKIIDETFSNAKKDFIEESEFFNALKENSIKKWQKAVSLFWSEVTIDRKKRY